MSGTENEKQNGEERLYAICFTNDLKLEDATMWVAMRLFEIKRTSERTV
jgi:hypothetical protein